MIPALASVALSFKQVQSNILKIVKVKEQEKLQKKFDDTRAKQQSYKSRFQKPTQVRKISPKDSSQLSLMSIISGLSGIMKTLFVFVGISGLFSIIKKSGIGEYIFKFVKDSLSSIVDLIKKTISFVRDVFSDSNVQQSLYNLAVGFFKFLGTLIVASATLVISLLRDSEVLETLKNVVVAVFKAVVAGIKASYEIISKLVMDNWETIKQSTFDVFMEIKNALVLSLQTLGSIFSGGIDPRISDGLKEIFVAAWSFISTLFTTEFKDPETGKSSTLLHDGLLWVAKMGALAAAWTVFAFYLREKGKQLMGMSFQDLKNSACDCLDLPDGDRKGKGKPKAEMPKEKSFKDSIKEGYEKTTKKIGEVYSDLKEGAKKVFGKITDFGERVIKKAKSLGLETLDSLKSWAKKRIESTGRIFKAIGKNPRILKKIGTRIAAKLGEKAALLMSRVAMAAAGVATGGVVTAIMVVLAAYDALMMFYGIYELLFVSTDGEKQDGGYYPEIKAEVESWLKDNPDTTPTPVAAPVATPTTGPAPTPAATTASSTTSSTASSTPSSGPKASSTSTSAPSSSPSPAPASAPAASSSPTAPAASMTTPTAVSAPNVSTNVESRKVDGLGFGGPRTSTKGVIIHHTGGRGLDVAIKTLQSRKLSYHYLVDRDGRIVNVLPDNLVGWHAGHTNKKPELNNSNTVSISMVAKDDTDVTPEQLAAASALEEQLAKKYGFPKSESYGHGEVSSQKHPKEGFTIATAIRGGREASVIKNMASNAVEDVKGAAGTVGPAMNQASQTGGQILDAASNQLASGLRVLEDLFIKGRPSFTDLSTVINQNNTFSRPGGDLREREAKAIKFLIERQTI
jgi:N-acetylmuramoyl-L-alanine amidase